MPGWLESKKQTEDIRIRRGAFYPPIGSRKFFDEYRPPSELPFQTVITHLRQAVINVGRQLDHWRKTQEYDQLADIPAESVQTTNMELNVDTEPGVGIIEEKSELVLLWERAVYCEAKAEILKETLTADRRKAAENNAKNGDETEEKYREFSADAISLICGYDRVYVGEI